MLEFRNSILNQEAFYKLQMEGETGVYQQFWERCIKGNVGSSVFKG